MLNTRTVALRVPGSVALVVVAVACGVFASRLDNRDLGIALLAWAGVSSVGVFQWTRRSASPGMGPGVLLSVAALSTTFLLGLLGGDYRGVPQEGRVALMFGVGVSCLLAGGITHQLLARERSPRRDLQDAPEPFARRTVAGVATLLLVVEALNLATGTVPLFSANIDETRFVGGQRGAFEQFGVFLIGGLEWIIIVAGAAIIVRRTASRLTLALGTAALLMLGLLASRSFLLVVVLTLVIVLAVLGRTSIWRILGVAAVGVALLGLAGAARLENSDPTGERRAFLASHGYSGVGGLVVQSAASGPYVFGVSATTVPSRIPYQGGRFFFRDFRSQLPGHFFGRPQTSDRWVTSAILQRDPQAIGGSPPTLVGGLYIDFGPLGVIVGCFAIGLGLAALFRWTREAGTIGALTLYAYVSAWVALSAYSYLSFKPIVITVAVLAFGLHLSETRRTQWSNQKPNRTTLTPESPDPSFAKS